MILADQRVVPCCEDISGELTLADITQTDIRTLWHENARLQTMRERHLRYDYRGYPRCAGCEVPNLSLLKRKAAEAEEAGGG